MKVAVALLLLSLSLVHGQTFQADFSISNDPNIVGIMNGTINYDSPKGLVRSDFLLQNNGGIISEFFNYTAHLRFLRCTVCETTTNNAQMPTYFLPAGTTGGTDATVEGVAATLYDIEKNGNPVSKVYIAKTGGAILKAEFKLTAGATSPKTILFKNHRALDGNAFQISSWNCPQQKCSKMIDLILVFDESGSITPGPFRDELNFGATLADYYTFGPDAVQMGFVQFSDNARLTAGLTPVKQNFVNQVRAASYRQGQTCTGCGMALGYQELRGSRSRSKATKVMITLTDGQSNIQFNGRSLQNVADEVKGSGTICFGIGVGAGVVRAEIDIISSSVPGVQTAFPSVPNFKQLNEIIGNLATATCVDLPGTPCGAACRGFCICGGQCVCPSDCKSDNCTQSACREDTNGAGCFTTNVCDPNAKCKSKVNPDGEFCDDHNECTLESCSIDVGCVRSNKTCSTTDPCLEAGCSTAIGCVEKQVDCLVKYPKLGELISTCYTVDCNATQGGCYLNQLPNTTVDSCGICNGNDVCRADPLPASVPYALTGGALAAVVIFAIVAAAALGAAGGKTGYNIWMNHRNHISGAQTSPLYTDSGLTGASPLYKA